MEERASAPGLRQRLRDRWRRIETAVPPARVLWIALAFLGAYGVWFLGDGRGALALVTLPLLAALVDVGFQRYRYPTVRVPDAALVTGILLAVVLPPLAPWAAGAALVVGVVALRHGLRSWGRPWFNPAATGVLLAAFLFGLAPAWWGSISLPLTLAAGAVVTLWNRRNALVPLAFLGSYAVFTTLVHLMAASLVGTPASPPVLLLAVTDPSVIFFGLFMVAEPRSSPSRSALGRGAFGSGVALGTALGLFLLPSLAGIVALLAANLAVIAARGVSVVRAERAAPGDRKIAGRSAATRWTIGMRMTTVFAALLLLGFAVPFATVPGAPAVPLVSSGPPALPAAGGSPSATACAHDSPTIPRSTLTSLHQVLGPSVILSDNPSTGVVVFYDPVHHVTVTETDLYEDFGAAEFNGDDYAVSGCAAG
ncbi:MAG TPA: RnfABCDGE type electron transport complex subunit D [Thermoplasmata archaeon]|nr:RnfABCDGE type electron transport complex subunit D [Thermoplasmata archaeon]